MNFVNAIENELDETLNVSFTENGAISYSTTASNLLDMSYSITKLRNSSEDEIIKYFEKAFYENKINACKFLFYLRDIRYGIGERRVFKVCLKWLAEFETEICKSLIYLVPEYGRWDDLYVLFDTDLKYYVLNFIKEQFYRDIDDCHNNKNISLLAKWMPSENTSSKETVKYARIIREYLGLTSRQYRKTLSSLRERLSVVERCMSNNQWNKIDYNTVPSKANLIYSAAFLRNDTDRRNEYLNKLSSGSKDVKINAKVLNPCDIVNSYDLKKHDETIEQLWNNLIQKTTDNVMVVRDGSGSMEYGCNPAPLVVSTALAIYMSEHNTGEWNNKFITFSSRPKMIDLSKCETLRDKLKKTYSEDDCTNTDIQKVMKLVLDTAIKNNISQCDMPKSIIIISDMQFDQHSHNCTDKLFNVISQEYEDNGYLMPRIVFWNVSQCYSDAIPLKQNKMGLVLMSGYSVNLLDMIMSNEIDPLKILLEQINVERYNIIEDIIKQIKIKGEN